MNDWKQTQFGKEYDAFRQELDDYYAAYPTDVSALEQELDEKSRLQPQAGAMEKKTWIYELAAEKCRVKLFRHCPFYFETPVRRAIWRDRAFRRSRGLAAG